jgi:hypothetical protein
MNEERRYAVLHDDGGNPDEPITLDEAAHLAGYRDASTLRLAALAYDRGDEARKKLKTTVKGKVHRFTTRRDLDAYLASLNTGRYGRGQPRGRDAGAAPRE